jgi:hypothetical protein
MYGCSGRARFAVAAALRAETNETRFVCCVVAYIRSTSLAFCVPVGVCACRFARFLASLLSFICPLACVAACFAFHVFPCCFISWLCLLAVPRYGAHVAAFKAQLRAAHDRQEQLLGEARDLRTALARERPYRLYAENVEAANRRLVVSAFGACGCGRACLVCVCVCVCVCSCRRHHQQHCR